MNRERGRFHRPMPASPRLRSLLQVAAAAAVAFTARASLADHYRVPSGSMEPTVHVGDRIVVVKAAYGVRVPMTSAWVVRFGEPARGDVVVIEPPEGGPQPAPGEVLLKRVVALGGETVEVRDGRVMVDDLVVDEATITLASGGGPDFGPSRVPDRALLVLGDNRGNSRDGRAFGFVDRARVLGRAVAVVGRDGHLAFHPL
jgi:signal peptidase I